MRATYLAPTRPGCTGGPRPRHRHTLVDGARCRTADHVRDGQPIEVVDHAGQELGKRHGTRWVCAGHARSANSSPPSTSFTFDHRVDGHVAETHTGPASPTSSRAHLFPRWARSVLFRRSAVAGTGHGRHLEHGEAPGFPTPRASRRQTGATTRHQACARRAAPPRASCSNIDSNRATPTARHRPGTPARRFQVGARAATPSTSADSARRAS